MNKIVFALISFMLLASNVVFSQQGSTKKNDSGDPRFPFVKGNLWMDKDNIKMNYLKNNEIRSDTVRIYNAWDKPMEISVKNSKPYMEVLSSVAKLAPKQEGMIIVKYDGSKKMDFGYCYENLNLLTNDTLEASKYFFVMVYIEEDFSSLTAEQRDNGPRINFETEKYEFGNQKEGCRED